mmetsp:Transcript_41040/g.62113  ORF Transcript_41040/g.62113 Transcript_41040/m.62113 type:complete len:202 (-) Transcript_41040:259-864(-)
MKKTWPQLRCVHYQRGARHQDIFKKLTISKSICSICIFVALHLQPHKHNNNDNLFTLLGSPFLPSFGSLRPRRAVILTFIQNTTLFFVTPTPWCTRTTSTPPGPIARITKHTFIINKIMRDFVIVKFVSAIETIVTKLFIRLALGKVSRYAFAVVIWSVQADIVLGVEPVDLFIWDGGRVFCGRTKSQLFNCKTRGIDHFL